LKVVVAIIKPFKLAEVHDALHTIGITGSTVCEAKGHGHQKGLSELYRSVEYVAHHLSKLRVELITTDDRVDQIVALISDAVRTGQAGDGKIYVQPVENVVRIRTGDVGELAL